MNASVSPRKSPRQQRSRETVSWILTAATQLFTTHGYHETTTNKIADRAGVSIGSLYQYFPNKDALLVELADRHMQEAAEQATAAIARASAERGTLADLLRTLVTTVAELHSESALHQLLMEHALRSPELLPRLRRLEHRIAEALAGELRRFGVGGTEPRMTALLAVQGIDAHIHGVVLDPPFGRTTADSVEAVVGLWTSALAGARRASLGP